MFSDFSSWLVWLLPLISCLFVPVVARIGGKAKEYYAVAITLVTTILALSLIPDVISSSGGATRFICFVDFLFRHKRRRLHRPIERLVRGTHLVLRFDNLDLLVRLHEGRGRLNTLLLFPFALHRLDDWACHFRQFPSNVHLLGDGWLMLLLAHLILE